MIDKFLTFFTDTIFRREADRHRHPVVRWLVQQYRLLFHTARGLVEHGTMVRSAALTFYTLMSIVPIVALIFAVMKGFGQIDTLIENLYGLFPQQPEVIDYLTGFAERALARTQGGVVALVGVAMLFWSVIRVFGSIESAFNHIWEVKTPRSKPRQFADYIAAVVAAPLLWVIANAAGDYAQELLGFRDTPLYGVLSTLTSLAACWVMFTLLYIVIPNTRVRFKSALTAGVVAGTIFLLFQWGYVYVQRWMTSYNAIYGSFAALPLFLIWMQSSWQILLFGGELAFAYQHIGKFAEERESLLVSHDDRRKVTVAVMLVIARRFRDEGGAIPAEEIRRRLNLPTRIVNDVLYRLVQAGLVLGIRNEEDEKEEFYAPARDISTLTVAGVVTAVERYGSAKIDFSSNAELAAAARAVEQLGAAVGPAQREIPLTELE